MNSVIRNLVTGLALAMSCTASFGADLLFTPDSMTSGRAWRDLYEVRAGAFLHGLGSREAGPTDLNVEVVLPRPAWLHFDGWVDGLVPRPHFGGMANFTKLTSYVYFGALWNYDFTPKFFIEGFLGGAYHDGSLDGDYDGFTAHRTALGCRVLFHSGGSLGYHVDSHWSVMATYDHLSNGNAVLGACPRNQGLTAYGLRLGYGF